MPISRFLSPLLFAASLAPLPAHTQTTAWRVYPSLHVEGTERLADGLQSAFRATSAVGQFAFETQRGVNGDLNGLPRHEIVGPQGVFTWLDTRPEWTLQLPETSLPELLRLFQPVRASLQELRGSRVALTQKFGQDIRRTGQATLCGRPCETVTVADANSPDSRVRMRLWVDTETGLLLRREEGSGSPLDYFCGLERFTPNPALEPLAFQRPSSAKTIRGLAQPEILLHASERRDYAADIAQTRRQSRIQGGTWFRPFATPSGFAYIQTVLRETGTPNTSLLTSGSQLSPEAALRLVQEVRNALLPGSEQEAAARLLALMTEQRALHERAIAMARQAEVAASESEKAVSRSQDAGDADAEKRAEEARQQTQVQAEVAALDQAVVRANMERITQEVTQEAYELLRKRAQNDPNFKLPLTADAGATVAMDFLDRETGDTVSFLQLRHRDWKALLHGFTMQTGPTRQSEKLGLVQIVTVTAPYPMRLLVWHTDATTCLLASTRLDVAQLLALAELPPPDAPAEPNSPAK